MTRDEWEAWRKEDVTMEVMKVLEEKRRGILEAWAAGQFCTASGDETLQLNAHAKGTVEALQDLLTMTFDDFKREIENG